MVPDFLPVSPIVLLKEYWNMKKHSINLLRPYITDYLHFLSISILAWPCANTSSFFFCSVLLFFLFSLLPSPLRPLSSLPSLSLSLPFSFSFPFLSFFFCSSLPPALPSFLNLVVISVDILFDFLCSHDISYFPMVHMVFIIVTLKDNNL